MLLSQEEVARFYRLKHGLASFVNRSLNVVPGARTPEAFAKLSPEARVAVRDQWVADPTLIDRYVEENPDGLGTDDLAIVHSWKHRLAGRFILFRQLKKHMIFLSPTPLRAYGVLALSEPFESVIRAKPPIFAETVLLPFRDRIVYEGHIAPCNVTFGGGAKRGFDENYREAKQRQGGVITSLPAKPDSSAKGG